MTAPLEVVERACDKLLVGMVLEFSREVGNVDRCRRGGVKMGGVELQLGYFRAPRARVVSTAVWFVADMLEVAVGAAAGPTVEVATDGCLLGLLVAGWKGSIGGLAKGVG